MYDVYIVLRTLCIVRRTMYSTYSVRYTLSIVCDSLYIVYTRVNIYICMCIFVMHRTHMSSTYVYMPYTRISYTHKSYICMPYIPYKHTPTCRVHTTFIYVICTYELISCTHTHTLICIHMIWYVYTHVCVHTWHAHIHFYTHIYPQGSIVYIPPCNNTCIHIWWI